MNQVEAARIIASRRRYIKRGEVEVDPGCEVAAVPTGIWVSAWIFVPKESIAFEMEGDFPVGVSACTT